jgi:ribose-phosphate pyrophosphokinase
MDNNILINGKPLNTMTFTGGEIHLNVNGMVHTGIPYTTITAHIKNSDDIMRVLLATEAIKANQTNTHSILKGFADMQGIRLNLPYVPYARQDRRCNPGEAHSLKVFAGLINAQQYDCVTVFDPHSDVVEALINNVVVVNNHNFIRQVVDKTFAKDEGDNEFFHLVSPDAGAYKKIHHLGKHLANECRITNFDIVTCNKERDTKTGAITNFTVGTNDLGGKPCLIADDILSKGGTFLGLAKALKERNCGELYLAISHDEGVADKETFKKAGFLKVFKTDSFSQREDDFFINYSWQVNYF